jgi:hypothetical protein
MKVDVIPLRVKGERRPPHALKVAVPVRGQLTVQSRSGRRTSDQVIVASLTDDTLMKAVLPALDHMRMTKLRGDSFILFGFEEVDLPGRQYGSYPQAWWCRIVLGAAEQATQVDEDEVEQLEAAF